MSVASDDVVDREQKFVDNGVEFLDENLLRMVSITVWGDLNV